MPATTAFVASLGREGQGPGEFQRASTATVIGNRLVVSDTENVRLSIWSTDGEHLDDVPLDVYKRSVSFLAGTEAGHAVVQYSPFTGPDAQNLAAATLLLDGTETVQYIDLPLDRTPTLQRGARRSFGYGNPRAYPSFAADQGGNIYITPGDEYQVLALAPDGAARWAMRVAWQRRALPQGVKDAVVDRLRQGVPDVTESEVNFLDRLPSVSRMVVDGAGRLFVYPYVLDEGREGVFDVPVDVYAPDGERLFAGMIPNRGWRRSRGEFVFGAGSDRVTCESRVFRWRLVVPFE